MERCRVENGQMALINERGQTESEFLSWYQKEEKDRYEKPSLTVDMLIFTVADQQVKNNRKIPPKELRVLLVKRKDHPHIGKWAIPGGFVNIQEGLEATAIRELKEETNLENIYMEQLYTWGDDVNRDPRMRVVSTSYMSLIDSTHLNVQAGDDAEEAKWFRVTRTELAREQQQNGSTILIKRKLDIQLTSEDFEDKIIYTLMEETTIEGAVSKTRVRQIDSGFNTNNIAFDHIEILNYGLDRLRNKLEYTPIAFNLMPQYFTLTELQMVYETILGKPLLKPNFRRKIMPMVLETEKEKADLAHRPSKLYTFNVEWQLNQW